jgi:cytochrome c oxidase cbb3-type subunit 2
VVPGSVMPDYSWLANTDLDFSHIDGDLRTQAALGVPYTPEMIKDAQDDVVAQATIDNPNAADLVKRYARAQARDFDGNPTRITEADALIAYLQMLGTQVDFKLYDDKANIR